MIQKLNYNQLFYFYLTVKEGSMRNAAKVLNQPEESVAYAVKTLQKDIGFLLVERKNRAAKPTLRGADIYLYCKDLFAMSDSITAKINKYSQENRHE